MTPLFAFIPGPIEIIIVIGVVLLVRRLPEVAHFLGKTIAEFKRGMKGVEDDFGGK